MSDKRVAVGGIDCGADRPYPISELCVIDDASLVGRTAERLEGISTDLDVPPGRERP